MVKLRRKLNAPLNVGRRNPLTIQLSHGMAKVSKIIAEYTNHSRTEQCKDCIMFIPTDGVSRDGVKEEPTGECNRVKGDISPVGHCKFWEGKATRDYIT